MRQIGAAIFILAGSSYCVAAEPAATTQPATAPRVETQPASRPATMAASMPATQPNAEQVAAQKNAERQFTINSKLKADTPVTVKNYWEECLEYRPHVIRDVQTMVDAARRSLDRTNSARIGTRPTNVPYNADILYYSNYATKQTAVQSAKDLLARHQETYKKINSEIVPLKPLKDPLLQQGDDSPLGNIGTINYLLINKIVSQTEAIVALNWMPVQPKTASNQMFRPGMPPYYMSGTAGVPSPTAYLRYPPSPYVYTGGFNYIITNFNTQMVVEGSKIQRPILVQVTGTRKMEVEGEERSVFILRVLRLDDFFEPE